MLLWQCELVAFLFAPLTILAPIFFSNSVVSIQNEGSFGLVRAPRHDVNASPSLGKFEIKKPNVKALWLKDGFSNCKDLLGGSVQLQWEKDGDEHITFKMSGRITEKQWMGLGFSPLKGKTQMVGGDAIVIYYTPHSRERYHADDYFMSAKSQCDGTDGVCPDERIGGNNDVIVLHGARKNGVTTVIFRRSIKIKDVFDLSMEEDEVNIFVAIGNLNGRNEANYHFGERTGPEEDIRIILKGKGDHACPTIIDDVPVDIGPKLPAWEPIIIEGVTNFTARIGPTGGKRGYTAITGKHPGAYRPGNPSWGICWYLNDQPIPEVYVERGETYYFWVEGGKDRMNPSKYHPFYITDSSEGGYGQKSESEQSQQKVFQGVGFDSSGYPYPKSAGRYCEWEHTTVDKSAQSESFETFFKTLTLSCEDGRPELLTWTVPQDAPDTLYYQCYTHNNLGWKIHVLDNERRVKTTFTGVSSSSLTVNKALQVFIPLLFSFIFMSMI